MTVGLYNLVKTMPVPRSHLLIYSEHRKLLLVLVTLSLWLPFSEPAAVALPQYTMDQRSDCISAGYLDIPRGQITKVQAPSKDASTSTQVLSCRLQFSAQTEGDTLKMTLEPGSSFEDCDVSLELQMNNNKIIRGCKSGSEVIPALEAVDGKASVWLSRRQFDDTSYWFQVTITSVRTEVHETQGTARTGDLGMILGIAAGIIVFLVIAVIICVWCYYKRRNNEREQTKNEYNIAVKNSLSVSAGHGYENNVAKITDDDSFQKSPGSDRKLLGKNYSGSHENNGKPKSALERFGPPPSQRGHSNVDSMDTDALRRREKYVVNFTRTGPNLEDSETEKSRDIYAQKVARNAPADIQSQPKSNFSAAVQNEMDAKERMRKLSDNTSFTNSSASADSESVFVKKPRLPPVPKSPPRSPSPQRQGEKIAGIFRARPSSSSSEIARFEDEESEDRSVKAHRNPDSHKHCTGQTLSSSSGERRKLERKLGEEKRMGIQKEEKFEDRKREKKWKDEEKLRRKHHSQDDGESEQTEDKKINQKRERTPRNLDEDDDTSQRKEKDGEYERRFKKSASGRKPKGKGQRMGRSRSTGNALEELDTSYQHAHSKSPSSVRSLILVDDDDDELDSSYMPFRRSGSKTSLYASRSSLYGRRRKNSMGETVSMSSYMHDDVDSRMGDFDKTQLSHKEKERLFKSTGDLDLSSASALIFRECATQTGKTKEVYVYGRKTVFKNRAGKCFSRGTQTVSGYERRDSTGSAKSGRSVRSSQNLKSRSKSHENLRKEKLSREFSEDHYVSDRNHSRRRSKPRDRDYSENEDELPHHHSKSDQDDDDDSDIKSRRSRNKSRKIHTYSEYNKPKQKSTPNLKPRKSLDTVSSNLSDDQESIETSSAAPSSIHQISQQIAPVPQLIPTGYPVTYPQPAVAYLPTSQSGYPMMFPVTSVPQSAMSKESFLAAKSNVSKWDQLVNLTEGMKKRRHQMGESLETESILSSTWSQPVTYANQPQAYYSPSPYTTAQRIHDPGSTNGSTYTEPIDITKPPKRHDVI